MTAQQPKPDACKSCSETTCMRHRTGEFGECDFAKPPRPHTPATERLAIPNSKICDMCERQVARTATLSADIKWSTALNTLITTESKRKDKESVNMVYSYRIAQVIESLRSTAGEKE